jgi:hypothetical protein
MSTNIAVEAVAFQDQLKQSILSVVNSAIVAGKDVVDFAYEQAPMLVREIISYNIVINGTYVFLSFVLFALAGFLLKISRKMYKENMQEWKSQGSPYISKDSYEFSPIMLGTFGFVLPLVAGLALFFANIGALLKVVFAPRLFLLEYISTLVK